MCETASAFSIAYTDWSPEMDAHRLSTHDRDHAQMTRWLFGGLRAPSQEDETRASAILNQVDEEILRRFGLDRVVARNILCTRAIDSGVPIVTLASALARTLKPSGTR